MLCEREVSWWPDIGLLWCAGMCLRVRQYVSTSVCQYVTPGTIATRLARVETVHQNMRAVLVLVQRGHKPMWVPR